MLGEYGGKPGSATQYVQIAAKEAAGNNRIEYANNIWQIPFTITDNPNNRIFTLKAIKTSGAISLKSHPLEDIDKTREQILSLGSQEGLIQFEAGKVLYSDYTGVGRALTDILMYHLGELIEIIPYTFTPSS